MRCIILAIDMCPKAIDIARLKKVVPVCFSAGTLMVGALLFGVAGMLMQLDVTAFLASSLRRIFFN